MALSTKRWQKIILALFMLAVLWVPAVATAQDSPEDIMQESIQVELNQRSAGDGTDVELTGWRYRIYEFITGFGALFAKLGGWLLDVSISAFVLNMKGTADYLGFNSVIGGLWVVVRDLFNLLFIFGLIWIGFQTILQADESGTKRLLGSLIAAALLINFSLYISKVIIDFTNIAAYQIGQQMSLPAHDERIFGVEVLKVSSAFVAATDFDQFPAESKTAVDKLFTDQTLGTFLLGFVVMAMLIILGFVFAAGAIILFTRFVALLLLMAFSPAMFLGWVFPKFSDFGKKWWSYFFNQAIVGPAYIFMLYVALLVTQGMQGLAEYTITGLIVYFLLVVAFIWAALLVARHFGAVGATQAINIGQAAGKRVRGYAGNASFGSVAWGLRNSIGRAADAYAKSDKASQLARRGGLTGTIGRAALLGADNTRKASFDARRVGGFGKATGLGEGKKGGFVERQKAITKKEKRLAGLLKKDEGTYYSDAGVSETYKTYQQVISDRDELYAQLADTKDPTLRLMITKRLNQKVETAKMYEEADDKKRPAGMSDLEWGQIKTFSQAKKGMGATIQNEYAANLERRGDKLPTILKPLYRVLIRTKSENQEAATSIRTEAKKSKEEKSTDRITSAIEKGSKSES